MAADWADTEKRYGAATVLSLLGGAGAIVMYLGAGEPLSGWGFALAMIAASGAVVAFHL